MKEYIGFVSIENEVCIDDHQPIVRCRDCKHGHESDWPVFLEIPSDYLDCTGPLVETWDYYHDEPKDNPVPPDGFCKWGERRENE